MTHEEKIQYMKYATGICHYGFTTKQLDLLVSLYEKVLVSKGETSLMDISKIEAQVEKRAEIARKKEVLDEFSKKKK